MPYSEAFPYAQSTELLSQQFPPWMAARRRRDSNLQQYLNTIGLEIDELREDAQALWNSVFIGTLDPDIPAWLQKTAYSGGELSVVGFRDGEPSVELAPVERLRDFLRSDDHVYIVDQDQRVIYFRQRYDTVHINNVEAALQDHHVWNSFDEFAFRAGLRRQTLESNQELRRRVLYAFRCPHGVAAPLANFVGLLAETEWPKEAPFVTLDKKHALVDTIRINDRPVLPGQVADGNTLVPQVLPLVTDGEHEQTASIHQALFLAEGALEGTFVSALLEPGNLGQWSQIELAGEFLPHQVSIDLLPAYYTIGGNVRPIISGLKSTQALESEPEGPNLSQPVFVRVHLRRKRNEAPPKITQLTLHYAPRNLTEATEEEPAQPSVVQYLYGVQVESLHDHVVKSRLMQELEQARRDGGHPYLLQLIEELATAIPVLWDQFLWDEAYWDIYETSLVGLDTLDSPWSGTLAGIRQLQPGIGHGDDIKTRHEGWRIVSRPGVYYSGPGLEEHYLFAAPERITVPQPLETIAVPAGPPGTPVIIQATVGQETRYLQQVCFLDASFSPVITNTEELVGQGRPYVLATYGDLDIDSVVVEGYVVDAASYDGSDRIPLTAAVPEGESVMVHYKIRDSFTVSADEEWWVLELSGAYDEVEIITEGGEERTHELNLDPATTHLRTGFLYLDASHSDYPAAKLQLRAAPTAVPGDGHGRVLITLDIVDRWGNPVYVEFGQDPIVSVMGGGTVAFVDAHANRFQYQYTSDVVEDEDEEVLIQATLGDLEATVALVVKGVTMD